ncbi:MAG: cobalt ECF transporter T component CbiQ [Planctomycetota bacterium]|nr:MAG: cobalt ECF transporter T component CbiQ [Planctomycetota bacterium]
MSTAPIVFRFDDRLRRSPLNRIDPRARVVVFAVFAFTTAFLRSESAMIAALGVAVLVTAIARVPPGWFVRRLLPVDLFVLVMALVVPWSVEGRPLATFGPLTYSDAGLQVVWHTALRANAIVAAMLALLGTMELPTLGHALSHLRVPDRLVHLLLFAVRYLEVLFAEYVRLRTAMRLRGFRRKTSRHAYRAFGYLIGMLLVRSLERSERVARAMRLRGFRGRFYLLDHFHFHWIDLLFAAAAVFVVGGLVVLEVAG